MTGAKARGSRQDGDGEEAEGSEGASGCNWFLAAVELTLDRVVKAAERSRGELEPALSVAIRLARAEIEECALILKHAESFADGGRFRAANERVLDVEPKLHEVQHLLNAATLLNRRMKELADRD